MASSYAGPECVSLPARTHSTLALLMQGYLPLTMASASMRSTDGQATNSTVTFSTFPASSGVNASFSSRPDFRLPDAKDRQSIVPGLPARAAALEDMRNRLAAWMKATDDPLLKGPVALPPTGQVNDPDGLSPSDPLTGP